MDRHPVDSSNIAAIGYDPVRNVLEVEFLGKGKPGSVYEYLDVPEDVYMAFDTAESKGTYFHANIRDVYQYQKLV